MKNFLKNTLGEKLKKDENSLVKTYWDFNILLPYFKMHLIRGLKGQCPFSLRPGIAHLFNQTTCISNYARFASLDISPFMGMNYVDRKEVLESRGMIESYPDRGYFKYIRLDK